MSEIPRIFVEKQNINIDSGIINVIDVEDIHYLTKVQRVNDHSTVTILDNSYGCYICKVHSIEKKRIELHIKKVDVQEKYPDIDITLIQSFLPSNKMDLVIQKSTELGVNQIIIVHAEYSKSHLKSQENMDLKEKRYQKIAIEASRQSKRGNYPIIHLEGSLSDYLNNALTLQSSLNYVCMETHKENYLKSVLQNNNPENIAINVFIGPEGGWSSFEKELFNKKNIIPVSLGKNILRAETASIIMIGNLLYEYQFS